MRWKLGMAGLLLSLAAAAASPVAAAEPPSEKSFLLRYYYQDVTDSGTSEKEILVFRDGLSVERFRIDSYSFVTGVAVKGAEPRPLN